MPCPSRPSFFLGSLDYSHLAFTTKMDARRGRTSNELFLPTALPKQAGGSAETSYRLERGFCHGKMLGGGFSPQLGGPTALLPWLNAKGGVWGRTRMSVCSGCSSRHLAGFPEKEIRSHKKRQTCRWWWKDIECVEHRPRRVGTAHGFRRPSRRRGDCSSETCRKASHCGLSAREEGLALQGRSD